MNLLPCPFCGKTEPIVQLNKEDHQFQIICNVKDGGCGSSCGFEETKDEAIKLWNTRSTV